MSNERFNIAEHLAHYAQEMPFHRAIVFPEGYNSNGRRMYSHLTYKQLNDLSDQYAHGFSEYGIDFGVKTLLFVKPSLDFFALTFALFKTGAVPVLIDPGMGVKRLLECIRHVAPEAFIGIPKAHLLRVIRRRPFRSVKHFITVGKKWLPWRGATLNDIRSDSVEPFEIASTGREDLAAILFTTGSTGPAKGVCYEHGIFGAQTEALKDLFDIKVGDIDLPGFPLFALFSVAMGMTSIIPDMDPTKPAQIDPKKFIEAINDHGVTYSFGSPAIWRTLGKYCMEHGVTFPSLRRITMAGAPVPGSLLKDYQTILPNGETYTPYGATENLPAAVISGTEVVSDTWQKTITGAGTCVGKPVPGSKCRIIRIIDEAIEQWDDDLVLPDGEIGELCFTSPVTTKAYYNLPEATRLAKIQGNDSEVWHRMGDVGYFDDEGRIWFCGRKNHRVVGEEKIWFPVKCEGVINEHADVFRSALVGIGKRGSEIPAIIIEPHPSKMPETKIEVESFKKKIIEHCLKFNETSDISIILFHPSLPVDIRHNAKIFREKLKVWAERQIRG